MQDRIRTWLRWLLAAAFLFAGYKHITDPGTFLPIVPGWVPAPRTTVLLTGWCELAGAVGLIIPHTRWWAGVMLALYAVCVFPANIGHALFHPGYGVGALGWWYHGPRLTFQPVIVWWCLWAARVIDWPAHR